MRTRENILDDVSAERERQEHLKAMGKFPHTPADAGALSAPECLAVLAEEFGEVAEIVSDAVCGRPIDPGHLREELIQVAAVCVAWVEGLDEEENQKRDASLTEADLEPQHLGLFPGYVRPAPAVLMYTDLYSDEELAERAEAMAQGPWDESADWQRDPEVGAE